MFAWLKKRQLNEHKKLFYQNIVACDVLASIFERNANPTEAIEMRRSEELCQRILATFNENGPLSLDDQRTLLDINRELRKIDHYVFRSVRHFDEAYKPPLGWEDYYANFPRG